MIGFVYDDIFLEHESGYGHPESPSRLRAITAAVDSSGLPLARIEPKPASETDILRVHGQTHFEKVAASAGKEVTVFDADTRAGALSYEAALKAAGGLITACDAVHAGEISAAFAAVRPPGHHAEADRVMGFCLFNNVAVAAAYLLEKGMAAKVAIIDPDVHHGNGTQHIFEADPRVLYVSSHRYPYYPGSGHFREQGTGEGAGFTLNLPLPAGTADADFLTLYTGVVGRALKAFAPDFIIISAGYDAHRADPLGGLEISTNGFEQLAAFFARSAAELCGGRLVFALEGGYDTGALADSVIATLGAVQSGRGSEPVEAPAGGIADQLGAALAEHPLLK